MTTTHPVLPATDLARLPEITARLAADADEHDRTGEFPFDGVAAVHGAGLLTATVATRYGGPDLGLADGVRILRALGAGDPSVALVAAMTLFVHAGQARTGEWADQLYAALLDDSAAGPALVNALRVEPDLGTPARGGLPARGADGRDVPAALRRRNRAGREPRRGGRADRGVPRGRHRRVRVVRLPAPGGGVRVRGGPDPVAALQVVPGQVAERLPISSQPRSSVKETRYMPRFDPSTPPVPSIGTTVAGHAVDAFVAECSRPVYWSNVSPSSLVTGVNSSRSCGPPTRKLLPDENSPTKATLISVDRARDRSLRTVRRLPFHRSRCSAPMSIPSTGARSSHVSARSRSWRSSIRRPSIPSSSTGWSSPGRWSVRERRPGRRAGGRRRTS
jgi:hypothetical protein